MPAVPETKSGWVDNVDALSSTNLNAYLRDPVTFLMKRPAAQLRSLASQTLTSGSWASMTYNGEQLDSDPEGGSAHSTLSNTSRYTARYPGWYLCSAACTFIGNATGRRGGRWSVNGSTVMASEAYHANAGASSVTAFAPTMLVYLYVGDYLEFQAFQESGGNLGTFSSTNNQTWFTTIWERLSI